MIWQKNDLSSPGPWPGFPLKEYLKAFQYWDWQLARPGGNCPGDRANSTVPITGRQRPLVVLR